MRYKIEIQDERGLWHDVRSDDGVVLTFDAEDAARKALAVYAQALEGGVERFLQGPAVKPVFRQFN